MGHGSNKMVLRNTETTLRDWLKMLEKFGNFSAWLFWPLSSKAKIRSELKSWKR